MKKTLILALTSAMSIGAMAEGYQVNSFSAKQNGMGHVGVAMKLGAESQIFNPAAVTFMNKTMEISGSISGISSECTATTANGTKYTTSNPVSTPLNISSAFRIYDNLYAGVTLYTPLWVGHRLGSQLARGSSQPIGKAASVHRTAHFLVEDSPQLLNWCWLYAGMGKC